ncbi:hypothetical protein VTN31DRAFT_4730 [Thermomyces dupontii]|uniref:uncharacterized protein n=1 Tax=Talaromyces thermophilus TaxID=28565 RepID=UPI0037422D43
MTEENTAVVAETLADVPQVTFKKRSAKAKASFRKRAATPPEAAAASSVSDAGFTSSEDEEGRQIKRRRKNAAVTASSTSTTNKSTNDAPTTDAGAGAAPLVRTNDATKHSNWYDDEEELSARNLLGKTRPNPSSSSSTTSTTNQGDKPKPKQFGPTKTATNVRMVTMIDYAPDVCKDWKQTGFCGFGDSCKFLHAREDYAQGWELDRQWEEKTRNGNKPAAQTVASLDKKRGGAGHSDSDHDEDDVMLEKIPFACIICKKSYTNPIVTKCGHYFCEACALQRYRKTPSCEACGADTRGVFNVAKKLNKLLEKKRERARKKREKAVAAGEEVPEEEDGLDK